MAASARRPAHHPGRPRRAVQTAGLAPEPRSSRAASSTAQTARSASSPSGRPGRHAPPAPAPVRDRGGRAAIPQYPWRHAQRVGLRPRLARRLGPGLAATTLARRPYDLRHAALSLWLNASGEPAEVAARAGTSTRVLHDVYVHCISGRDDAVSQRIEAALDPGASVPRSSPCGKASGYTHRRHHHPDPVRYLYATRSPGPAHSPRLPGPAGPQHRMQRSPLLVFPQVRSHLKRSPPRPGDGRTRPTHSPRNTADGPRNRSLSLQKPVTPFEDTGSELRKLVAGVGFEPT